MNNIRCLGRVSVVIGVMVLLLAWSSLPGCGFLPSLGGDTTPRTDRDLLPASIIDDFVDARITASESAADPGTWQFELASSLGPIDDAVGLSWDMGDGTIIMASAPTHTYLQAGSYLVTVTAGDVAFVRTLLIDVQLLNNRPVARAGADRVVAENATVFLYAGDSYDPDDDELAFSWQQIAGPAVQLTDGLGRSIAVGNSKTTPATNMLLPRAGSQALTTDQPVASFVAPLVDQDTQVVFSLTVSDGELEDFDTIFVNVLDLLAPASTDLTADAGPDWIVNEFVLVTLDGSNSTGFIGSVLTYSWVQLSGPPVTLVRADQPVAEFLAPAAAGATQELMFELVVTSGDLVASDVAIVMVVPAGFDPANDPTIDPCTLDTDSDGVNDCSDGCPNDPGKTDPGVCGCGTPEADSDGDTVPDCIDVCPGVADTDSDGDGVVNCQDGCPDDPQKTLAGICGCGVPDTDSDGNGTPDCNEPCAPGSTADSDGDGVQDCLDGCPNDATKLAPGVCGCGTADTDSDADGVPDCIDQCPGAPDIDTDGDGQLNCNDACPTDPNKTTAGVCGCGAADSDTDADGTLDCNDGCPADPNKTSAGVCGCGTGDIDSDLDGTVDCNDGCSLDANKTSPGVCGCGTPDVDSDGNGVLDCNEAVGQLLAAASPNAVVIDGALGSAEWSDANTYTMDASDQTPPGVVVTGSTTTASDASATIRIKHDPTYLYIGVEVQDDLVVSTAPAVWNADSVELFLDVDNSNTPNIGLNRFQVTLNAGGGISQTAVVPSNSWLGAATSTAGSYSVEFRFNKSAIGLTDNQTYGFDIAVSDIEPTAGAVDSRYWYFSTSPAETNETLWGDLHLEPGAPADPQLAVGTSTLNFGSTSTSRTFDTWNSGGTTLSYTITDDAPWLTVAPSSGSSTGEHDVITGTVNRGGLADGAYQGTITVTPNIGSATTIAVTMFVGATGNLPTPVIKANRTSGIAPFAVFFEATDSLDANGNSINSIGLLGCEIAEYNWTFGDGTSFSGFNAANVYEPAGSSGSNGEPSGAGGTFVATLTVRDKNGNEASTSKTITVQPFGGKTYYVRANGNDNNSGIGPGAGQAWKTYQGAFAAETNLMQPGDRLLFHRGDTFTSSAGGTVRTNNIVVAAYGTGAAPLIQYVQPGGATKPATILAVKAADVSIVDLRFDLQASSTLVRTDVPSIGNNGLFLRMTVTNSHGGGAFGDGMFYVDSVFDGAKLLNLFVSGTRLAMINSTFANVAEQHNIYGSRIDRGVITGSTFSNPGSCCVTFRVGANTGTSRNVYLSNNLFDGSTTWLAVQFLRTSSYAPDRHGENILFEHNNILTNFIGIQQGDDYRNTVIRLNTFQSGKRAYDLRNIPSDPPGTNGPKGVWFYGNTLTQTGTGAWFVNGTPDSKDIYLWDNSVNGTVNAGNPPP